MKEIIKNFIDKKIEKYGLKKNDSFENILKSFNNSFVYNIKWKRLKNSGSRRNNCILKQEADMISIRMNYGYKIFNFIFFLFVILIIIFMYLDYISINELKDWFVEIKENFFILYYIFIFVLILGFLINLKNFITTNYKIEFNTHEKRIILYWMFNLKKGKLKFDDIYAIQLIAKSLSNSEQNHYLCYEVNLVKNDGTRINIFNHGDLKEIKKQSEIIGNSLQKPIWDIVK